MLELRTVTADEFVQWVWVEARAYGNRLNADPETLRPHFDLNRSIAVLERGNIVGGAHSHRLEMSIPGGTAVVAGVANIAVQPTHRRRGIMTKMMRHQLTDIHRRGEAFAALFASESAIYGRFGYGIGSLRENWSIERQYNSYAHPHQSSGDFIFLTPAELGEKLPEVFRRGAAGRPGVFQKSPHLWQRESQSPEHRQGGPGGIFYVAYVKEGAIEGYVKYRISGDTLTVNELMAATNEANTALWRFCFDTDLVTRTEAERRPVDDPLPWLLADPRRLHRSTRDGLWLRLVDVSSALSQRSYEVNDRLVLEARDDFCPWNAGRFSLEGSPQGAECHPTDAAPDLTIDVAALATTFLGAAGFAVLAQAGLAEEITPDALRRADRMFAVAQKPWTPCGF